MTTPWPPPRPASASRCETQYNFEKAKVVLSLDGDFLSAGFPGFHRNARQFAARRRPELRQEMLRFYMVESTPGNTGGKADHRLPLRASQVEGFARTLAAQLSGGAASRFPPGNGSSLPPCIKDLEANRGRSIIVVGENQPPAVHMLAHAMNQALGNVGQTVFYTDSVGIPSRQQAGFAASVGCRDVERQGRHAGAHRRQSAL